MSIDLFLSDHMGIYIYSYIYIVLYIYKDYTAKSFAYVLFYATIALKCRYNSIAEGVDDKTCLFVCHVNLYILKLSRILY